MGKRKIKKGREAKKEAREFIIDPVFTPLSPNHRLLENLPPDKIHNVTQTVMTKSGEKIRFLTVPYIIPESGEKANIFAVDLFPLFEIEHKPTPEEFLAFLYSKEYLTGYYGAILHWNGRESELSYIFLSAKCVKKLFQLFSWEQAEEICGLSKAIG